jgi:pentatricopeptide repeat protein
MNQSQLINLCQKELDRMIDRMHDLCAEGRVDDAKSLYDEIKDWICLGGEIDVMSLNYINGIL